MFFLIDNLGRRNLLIIGAAGGSVCMWIIGGYISTKDTSAAAQAAAASQGLSSGGIAAIFFFYLWTAFYTPSWNGTPWVINSEMFDLNTRGLGQASASANNWFWVSSYTYPSYPINSTSSTNSIIQNFIISRFTPQMFNNMGPSGCGVFFFFASMMILSIFFVWFLVPETKSIPLESMDRLFEISPPRKANKIILAEDQKRDAEFRENVNGAGLTTAKEKADLIEKSSERGSEV